MSRLIDLTGRKFGRLTVLEKSGKDKRNHQRWLCVCECGNKKVISSSNLISGHTTSCGCYNKQVVSKLHKTHGMYGTRPYYIWSSMIQRCTNPNNHKYKNYGARNIFICDEWKQSFETFYSWAISNGYSDTLTIDRIDVNDGYYPENCRWVGVHEQSRNRTDNVYITINGETKILSDWCKLNGINPNTASQRITQYGWDEVRAVTEKPNRRVKQNGNKRNLCNNSKSYDRRNNDTRKFG